MSKLQDQELYLLDIEKLINDSLLPFIPNHEVRELYEI